MEIPTTLEMPIGMRSLEEHGTERNSSSSPMDLLPRRILKEAMPTGEATVVEDTEAVPMGIHLRSTKNDSLPRRRKRRKRSRQSRRRCDS